jgi:hypothetical protein
MAEICTLETPVGRGQVVQPTVVKEAVSARAGLATKAQKAPIVASRTTARERPNRKG